MSEDLKGDKYLDRYEVVAVAIPGAAFLLFVWYLHPELVGTQQFELKDVSVGTLGIFAIAAVVAGQLVQTVANVAEELLNVIADRIAPSPIQALPIHQRTRVNDRLMSLDIVNPAEARRQRYRSEFNKDIVRAARRSGKSSMIDVFNVTYGLNIEPLSARIFRLRIARGYSVYELATAAGVFAGTIKRLESGKPEDKRVLPALARALGVPFCRLVCGEHNCVERACVRATSTTVAPAPDSSWRVRRGASPAV